MQIPLIPQDKANHACYGAVIFLVSAFAARQAGLHEFALVGLGVAGAVGALKELADYVLNRRAIAAGLPPPHGVELLDCAATTAGGLVAYLACRLA